MFYGVALCLAMGILPIHKLLNEGRKSCPRRSS